jgi:sporulation-control protein spo0M
MVGCSKPLTEKELQGPWSGKVTLSDADLEDAKKKGMTQQQVDQAKSMTDSMTVTLNLKEGGKFDMTMGAPMEGSWTFSDMKVNLKVEKAMGMTIEQIKQMAPKGTPVVDQIGLAVNQDGKSMSGTNGPGQGTLSFTKAAKPE